MRREQKDSKQTRVMSRRRFVQGMAAGAGFAAYQWIGRSVLGETVPYKPAVLTGTHFDLTIDSVPVNYTGRASRAIAVNGSTPGPILRWREGDSVTISLMNRLKHATSIHWHGVRVPADMDGVPGLSFAGIPPGETFEYRFPVRQSGTYWYHSHSGFQEQTGLIGTVISRSEKVIFRHIEVEYLGLSSLSDRSSRSISASGSTEKRAKKL